MKTVKSAVAVVLLCMTCMAGVVFAEDNYDRCGRVPLQEARDAMVSDSEVSVTQVAVASWADPAYYYELKPNGITPQGGLIIYPGANVDVRSYAVMARAIAGSGFLVALVPMPSCIALYDNEGRASDVIANNPGITTWSIGGHSLGGVAAGYMITCAGCANIDKIKGVVLWAAYPDANQPLTNKPVKVISIWGTKDALATEQKINDSKPNLPADTVYVGLKGANHTQFGWYGLNATDYSYLSIGQQGKVDSDADISREEQHNLILSYTINFLDSLTPTTLNTPVAVGEVTADDGSVWEKVSAPGFIDRNNTDIVALTPYKGNLYALTRNDVSGFELWKTQPAQGWHRIHVQGFTDQSNYSGYLQQYGTGTSYKYSPNMNIWADMIEFKGHLYVGVSTGYQGRALFGSKGALIWRTDGVEWEPVIGGHEPYAEGTLSAISDCAYDGTSTALFTDSTQSWSADTLDNCTIEVESEFTEHTHNQPGVIVPGRRVFKITANTATQLTVQQDEDATIADAYESTYCGEELEGGGDPGRPMNNLPRVVTGAAYKITCGDHSQGFGEPWNKSIIDMEILDDVLYASIGLNYLKGARVMRTSDGLTWVPDSPYSLGNIHGEDWHDGATIPDAQCLDSVTTPIKGTPVSSSLTKMVKTSLTGQETLLIGGTGTTGCNGRGARIYRRDGDQDWTPIVDVLTDSNTSGTNENGFGYDSTYKGKENFFFSAFQAWSWVEYDNNLLIGVAKLEGGGMMFSTPSAAEADGAWAFSMGGQFADRAKDPITKIAADISPDPDVNGFGDPLNTAVLLHKYNNIVYAGTMVTNLSAQYLNPINGADMWKGTGPGDSVVWTRVNGDGFGDPTVLQFQSFVDYATHMHMVASTVQPSDFRGQEPTGYTGAVVYRLAEEACQNNSDCDDGVFCNGVETCNLSIGCVAGSSPCIEGQLCDEDNDQCVACLEDENCAEGYKCEDGECVPAVVDNPPAITAGPYLAAGTWPLLPTSAESPMYLDANYAVLWKFSDDFASCPGGACTHVAEYQKVGGSSWTEIPVTVNAAKGTARVTLPVESLLNATTYAFRYSVTDCASQATQSAVYYFRVALTDAPPVIKSGPYLATGSWPLMPTSASSALVLDQNYNVLWNFSDDYAFCSGLCTHRARYRKVGDTAWTWLTVSADSTGKKYAYTELPVSSLPAGTYQFFFDVLDCNGQRTYATTFYYFKVE